MLESMFHADSLLASIASVGTTLSVATTHAPDVAAPVSLLPYAVSLLGPVLVLVANRLLAAKAAGKRARAAAEREQANDATPDDPESKALRAHAAQLEAEAAELDSLKPGPK